MTSTAQHKGVSTAEDAPAKSLTNVLDHSERVQDKLAECAVELSAVNDSLKQELSVEKLPNVVENAIEKSEAIETKVLEASEELAVVNEALEDEIGARQGLQTRLAEVTMQKDAAQHDALHDPLTGLPNRALFHDRLEHALAQAARRDWRLAVLFIDLDKFKLINDAHGHATGDRMLIAIANSLKATARADDTISRYGGDEFLVLLTNIGDESVVNRMAEKMLHAIRGAVVSGDTNSKTPNAEISLSASIGVAIYPTDGLTIESLISAADKTMYKVKQS